MKRTDAVIPDYYNKEVVSMICRKYGFKETDAFRIFALSETHKILSDAKYEMWQFGAPAIFDMWENEKITGNLRNSTYIRGEF